MNERNAERIVAEYESGRLSRRQLITQLTALGAAAAGWGMGASAWAQDGAEREGTFSATSVDHVALSVTDVARSRDWYVKHLGLSIMRDGRSSCFLRAGERDFLALFKAEEPGLHHYSFAIPEYDQDDAARRLRKAGLEPKLRGGRTYFDDPDGIEVQVSPE